MIKIYNNRRSIRLKNYDYSKKGIYYVTICTINRENLLSNINAVGACSSAYPINDTYKLLKYKNKYFEYKITEIGNIIYKSWKNIPILNNNIKLHEFIIMPNHIHGIIEIQDYIKRK